MKRILFLLLFAIPFKIQAQGLKKTLLPIDSATNQIAYRIVESTPNLTKTMLYSNAKTWVAKQFNSPNRVVQMDDPESGKLIVKAFTPYYSYIKNERVNYKLWFTVSISVKSEKYKAELTDFTSQQEGQSDRNPAEMLVKPSLKELGWLDITVAIEDLSKIFLQSIPEAMRVKDDF
ncbi:DUF4468 domain-containing protein [Mucilaginibacter sp. P25]|uniref:DUF4468 domain-containing protein n=1 Tax=Mucilaginibacter sp. P25 TaxID=3423945 RepID=UPI003D798177